MVWRESRWNAYIAPVIEPLNNYAYHWQCNRITIDVEGELFTYIVGNILLIAEEIVRSLKLEVAVRVENEVFDANL